MPWEIRKLKEGELTFVVTGNGMVVRGRVHQGAMKGDVFWGLKALEYPLCKERLVHVWTAVVPRVYAGLANTGLDRRFVTFFSPNAPGFVLRFEHYPEPILLKALREAYAGRGTLLPTDIEREEIHEEPTGEAQLDSAAAGDVDRARRGDGQARRSTLHEQDPSAEGLEGVKPAVKRPAKKATPKKKLKRKKSVPTRR